MHPNIISCNQIDELFIDPLNGTSVLAGEGNILRHVVKGGCFSSSLVCPPAGISADEHRFSQGERV